jgi:hypothetical protein
MKYWTLILIIGLSACTGTKEQEIPTNVIPKEAMVPLLVDLQLIEGANNTKFFQGDTGRTNYALLYNIIFEKHKVEKARFDSSMAYYSVKTEDLEIIYDEVIEDLMKIEAAELATGQ